MKKVLFIISIIAIPISYSNHSCAQDPTKDSLQKRIAVLEAAMSEEGYTRIPNQDFENIIDNKIRSSIKDTLEWWLIILGALVSLIGFLINKYAKVYLEDRITKKSLELQKINDEKINQLASKYFSGVLETMVDFKLEMIEKKDFKVDETTVEELKTYLNDDSLKISYNKKVHLIDVIMTCYYYSDLGNRNQNMIRLIKEYEEKYTLLPTTYANAAIAFKSLYHYYGNKASFDSTLENIDKSLKALPDYGLAFALKIELYIMALNKSYDANEVKDYEEKLLKVFKEIDINNSKVLMQELISRMKVDSKSMEPYLEAIKTKYPMIMSRLEALYTKQEDEALLPAREKVVALPEENN